MARLNQFLQMFTAVSLVLVVMALVGVDKKNKALTEQYKACRIDLEVVRANIENYADLDEYYLDQEKKYRDKITFLEKTLKEVREALIIAQDGKPEIVRAASIPFVGK